MSLTIQTLKNENTVLRREKRTLTEKLTRAEHRLGQMKGQITKLKKFKDAAKALQEYL